MPSPSNWKCGVVLWPPRRLGWSSRPLRLHSSHRHWRGDWWTHGWEIYPLWCHPKVFRRSWKQGDNWSWRYQGYHQCSEHFFGGNSFCIIISPGGGGQGLQMTPPWISENVMKDNQITVKLNFCLNTAALQCYFHANTNNRCTVIFKVWSNSNCDLFNLLNSTYLHM